MKIVLVAGFLNNHLLPLCEELAKKSEFWFVATEDRKMFAEDKKYNRNSIDKEFVLHYFDSDERQQCEKLVVESDVAIFGGSSLELLLIRKKQKKISFVYSERVFKQGRIRRFYPPTRKILEQIFIKDNDLLYVLCASSFLAEDIRLIGFPKERCFKFGYLPQMPHCEFGEIVIKKKITKDTIQLLYVGRLLKLKRVKDIIKSCLMLKKANVQFQLTIVGDGPERRKLERYRCKKNLDEITFVGAQNIEIVMEYMKSSHILYLTSDRHEGWGAVVNEAMANGCVVIESDACGSASYMIENGINGFRTKCGSSKDIFRATMKYIECNHREAMHLSAYETVWNKWNAETAADGFINIANKLMNKEEIAYFDNGPMSRG